MQPQQEQERLKICRSFAAIRPEWERLKSSSLIRHLTGLITGRGCNRQQRPKANALSHCLSGGGGGGEGDNSCIVRHNGGHWRMGHACWRNLSMSGREGGRYGLSVWELWQSESNFRKGIRYSWLVASEFELLPYQRQHRCQCTLKLQTHAKGCRGQGSRRRGGGAVLFSATHADKGRT